MAERNSENKEKKRLEPDDDLRRAITMDEFRKRVLEDINQLYANKEGIGNAGNLNKK